MGIGCRFDGLPVAASARGLEKIGMEETYADAWTLYSVYERVDLSAASLSRRRGTNVELPIPFVAPVRPNDLL